MYRYIYRLLYDVSIESLDRFQISIAILKKKTESWNSLIEQCIKLLFQIADSKCHAANAVPSSYNITRCNAQNTNPYTPKYMWRKKKPRSKADAHKGKPISEQKRRSSDHPRQKVRKGGGNKRDLGKSSVIVERYSLLPMLV